MLANIYINTKSPRKTPAQMYKASALQKATIVDFCNAGFIEFTEFAEFDDTKSYDREFLYLKIF